MSLKTEIWYSIWQNYFPFNPKKYWTILQQLFDDGHRISNQNGSERDVAIDYYITTFVICSQILFFLVCAGR